MKISIVAIRYPRDRNCCIKLLCLSSKITWHPCRLSKEGKKSQFPMRNALLPRESRFSAIQTWDILLQSRSSISSIPNERGKWTIAYGSMERRQLSQPWFLGMQRGGHDSIGDLRFWLAKRGQFFLDGYNLVAFKTNFHTYLDGWRTRRGWKLEYEG